MTTATKDALVEETVEDAVYTPEEQAAFSSGFDGKKTETADVVAAEGTTTGNPPLVKTEEVSEVKLVELTEEKYQELLKTAKTLEELTGAVEQFKGTAFGKMGGLERTINELRNGQASGKPIDLSPEDLAELRTQYPEMTVELEKGLTRILGKIKTGGPVFDPASVEPLIQEAIDKAKPVWKQELRREDALEALTARHPKWEEMVGPTTSETDFRKWLKNAKTPEEQTRILDTWNPKAAGDVIDEFLEHQKNTAAKPKTGADDRRARIEQGVQPKGSAPPVPKGRTIEDEFNEGFKTGRS